MFSIPEIAERLRTQDNRGTQGPVFDVQELRKYCDEEGEQNNWMDSDWQEADAETSAVCEESAHANPEMRAVRAYLMEGK